MTAGVWEAAKAPAVPPKMQKSLAQVCMALKERCGSFQRRAAGGVCVWLSESERQIRADVFA